MIDARYLSLGERDGRKRRRAEVNPTGVNVVDAW
jgi:hypothetical protein